MTNEPEATEQPPTPGMRTFGLNSPEAYHALAEPRARPWIPNGALPREPRWPRKPAAVTVWAETADAADEMFRDWLWRVETGLIGGGARD